MEADARLPAKLTLGLTRVTEQHIDLRRTEVSRVHFDNNRPRLAIAAKYEFSEAELCDHYRSPIGSRRDLSLFQVNFYGFLQEFILRELNCEGPALPNG